MASPWIEGRVTELKAWGGNLYSLFVDADIASFEAGQFIKIGLPINDEIVGRAYSLVNAPNEKPLEFYFIKVDDGPLTPRLIELKPGDAIQVAPRPSGFLVLSEVPQAKNLWLIATGTGIGPFLSMLKTATTAPPTDIKAVTVSVDHDGKVFIDKQEVGLNSLEPQLRSLVANNKDLALNFQADEAVPYRDVAKAIASIQRSGVSKLSVLTSPAAQ